MVDKDKFRDKIVEVSSKIFSQYGFKKTTMEEIALALRKGKVLFITILKVRRKSLRRLLIERHKCLKISCLQL